MIIRSARSRFYFEGRGPGLFKGNSYFEVQNPEVVSKRGVEQPEERRRKSERGDEWRRKNAERSRRRRREKGRRKEKDGRLFTASAAVNHHIPESCGETTPSLLNARCFWEQVGTGEAPRRVLWRHFRCSVRARFCGVSAGCYLWSFCCYLWVLSAGFLTASQVSDCNFEMCWEATCRPSPL